MFRHAILSYKGLRVLALSTLGVAQAASADVLEIDSGEARWVAGGPAETSATRSPMSASYGQLSNGAFIPQKYYAHVLALSARYDLSPVLIEALVWQESRWRSDALSPKGATGLAQLMPETARELGVNPADPFANLEGGARYLRAQLDRFDGNLEKALAAYNAGPVRVERANGIPNIRETREYVAAIMARLSHVPNAEGSAAQFAALQVYEGSSEE